VTNVFKYSDNPKSGFFRLIFDIDLSLIDVGTRWSYEPVACVEIVPLGRIERPTRGLGNCMPVYHDEVLHLK